jgi:hypothetical protein
MQRRRVEAVLKDEIKVGQQGRVRAFGFSFKPAPLRIE